MKNPISFAPETRRAVSPGPACCIHDAALLDELRKRKKRMIFGVNPERESARIIVR